MQYERRADVLVYKGQERSCRTLAWWCTQCGEAIFAGKPLLARDRAFQQLKADVDQVLGPDEVAQVREKLRLSQRRAGEVLGGGPRAFQKYESGKQAVSVPMSNLLRRWPAIHRACVRSLLGIQGPRQGMPGAERHEWSDLFPEACRRRQDLTTGRWVSVSCGREGRSSSCPSIVRLMSLSPHS